MEFKTLLIFNSGLAFIGGIACLLAPAKLLSSYGIILIPMGLVIYQFWGTALIGLGMLTWFARNIKDLYLQKAFALSLFMMNSIIAIRGQYAGANDFGWTNVALYFLLALGFGCFIFMKRQATYNDEFH